MFPLISAPDCAACGIDGVGAVRGFTLIEAMLVLAILGILLSFGLPRMTLWTFSGKAAGATEFYAEGLKLARQQALGHNAVSRIVLTTNAANGQMDWQVDLCFPVPGVPCSNESGNWSGTTTPAGGDPEGAAGFRSVFRSAGALPSAALLQPSTVPEGSNSVYFNAAGWVDSTFVQPLNRIQFDPVADHGGRLHASALVVGLAGSVIKCDPGVAASDARACPP
jgi:type IV fimbrial biogenesis protein FimT